MIKVKTTFQHQGHVVCKGKLVLIKIPNYQIEEQSVLSVTGDLVKPIIISETELIEFGDRFYDKDTNTILNCDVKGFKIVHSNMNKILALPEHFSLEQLKMIVEDKLNDGDEVMVECEDNGWEINNLGDVLEHKLIDGHHIKFNQQNHITLIELDFEKRFGNSKLFKLKEESWDDILLEMKFGSKLDGYSVGAIRKYLIENYHPPKRKI